MHQSALETRLNEQQRDWLTAHLCERWGVLYRNLGDWTRTIRTVKGKPTR
jgi:hypothetical protein